MKYGSWLLSIPAFQRALLNINSLMLCKSPASSIFMFSHKSTVCTTYYNDKPQVNFFRHPHCWSCQSWMETARMIPQAQIFKAQQIWTVKLSIEPSRNQICYERMLKRCRRKGYYPFLKEASPWSGKWYATNKSFAIVVKYEAGLFC